MVSSHRKEPNYLAVFWWLVGLTIVEVGVIYLPLAKVVINILLVGFALSKVTLVAMYFMHLRFEPVTLSVIALIPLLLCVILVLALLPDHVAVRHKIAPTPHKSVIVR